LCKLNGKLKLREKSDLACKSKILKNNYDWQVVMEKGKIKKEDKNISILFIPHFSANVRSFKFSASFTKVVTGAVIITLVISSILLLTVFSFIENKKLTNERDALSNLNAEQNKLLSEKAEEISKFRSKENEFDTKAKDFMEKYRDITDNYIKGGAKPNRSGEGTSRTIVSDISDLKAILEDINKMRNIEADIPDDLTQTEEKLKDYLANIPTLWPAAGRISSTFGQRKDPFVWRKSFHTGIDIAASYGSKIKAAAGGKVILSKRISVYGLAVIIDHGNGLKTLYGHTSKLLVKEGQTVEKGKVIAYVGSSGRSTGAHLHFEVQLKDTSVNPLKYLNKK
jgi:murein DD-endopeptidase MepM/ murein hydrolase activator NlpD